MASWADLARANPALAAFGRDRLVAAPAYLATVQADGGPRVHPISPLVGAGELFVFMEPSSPKRHDLERRGRYALHASVAADSGAGGEFWVWGRARMVTDPRTRQAAAAVATFEVVDQYVLFELDVEGARANAYGDVALPESPRWAARPG